MGPSPLDLSVEEFLARLQHDRRATLAALPGRPWCLTALAVDPSDFWQLFAETVRDDGTVQLSALAAHADPPGSFPPTRRGAAGAVVGLSLAAYVVTDETGVTIQSAPSGVVTIRPNQKRTP